MATIFGEIARLFRGDTSIEFSHDETRAIAELKDSLSRAIRAAIVHRNGDCLEQFMVDADRIGLDVEIAFEYDGKQSEGVIVEYTERTGGVPAIRVAEATDDGSQIPVWTFRLEGMSNVQLVTDRRRD